MKTRLQISAGEYRRRKGYHLTGKVGPRLEPGWCLDVAIFVRRRETAEAIREAYKRNASDDEIGALIVSEGQSWQE